MKRNIKMVGTVNGVICATLFDANNNALGYCADTPNCVALAMATNKSVVKSVAHYVYFGDTIMTRKDLCDRFNIVNDVKTCESLRKSIVWY